MSIALRPLRSSSQLCGIYPGGIYCHFTDEGVGNADVSCDETSLRYTSGTYGYETRGWMVTNERQETTRNRPVAYSDVGTDLVKIEETGGNVILATPGRLNDIMKKKTPLNFASLEVCHAQHHPLSIKARPVQVLVLDEADRLLDLGFEAELLQIVHSLPKQRRTGLFSATQTVKRTNASGDLIGHLCLGSM